MKYIIPVFMLIILTIGCSAALRGQGETYSGYSCRESLMHFYSRCSNVKITKEEFEQKVQFCEKELATLICDREQADLLWCMGRVEPGAYTRGGGMGVLVGRGVVISSGQSSTEDGCSCASFEGSLRKCRMEKGIFDK